MPFPYSECALSSPPTLQRELKAGKLAWISYFLLDDVTVLTINRTISICDSFFLSKLSVFTFLLLGSIHMAFVVLLRVLKVNMK